MEKHIFLDDHKEDSPGRYEGESLATKYIIDSGDFEEETSFRDLDWAGLFITEVGVDPLRYPAYTVIERTDGSVVSRGFDSVDEARAEFETIFVNLEI